jgi:hypothetical protein
MSRAEEVYQAHLQELRGIANENGITFIDILIRLSHAYKSPGLHLLLRKNATAEEIERLEQWLIDEYRVKSFENVINAHLKVIDALNIKLKKNTENYEKAQEDLKKAEPAIKTSNIQQKNLKRGRQLGTEINKKRADAIKELAHQMNKDQLSHADTARRTLNDRAEHIHQRLASRTIEIEGKSYKATMANGEEYAFSTIKGWITGT